MLAFIPITICLLSSLNLSGQMLAGRIVDSKEQPVPNATVYIRETAQGIMADENGAFQTNIDAGDYTIDVSCLGYERKTMTVTVPPEGLLLTIQLTEKLFALREVIVTPGKEDPAYRIMRNVIARAPYHQHQVKSYNSDVYLKGAFIVDKIPALLKSQVKDKSMIGNRMVYESQNEISYHAPKNYEQRVIAINSTVPKELYIDDKMPLVAVMTNIYHPEAYGGLLGSGSFSVYKFKLEDIDRDGDHELYKIRIIPRKKSDQLVSGYLYVVDNSWSVRQALLEMSTIGASVCFNLSYQEVKPGAFLISAFDCNAEINVMGVKGSGQMYASVKYNQLETNDNTLIAKIDSAHTVKPVSVEQKPLTAKQQKDIQKIEELAAKENLSNRETYKMAQLVQKTMETDEIKESRRRLERSSYDSTLVVMRDSLALFRDSTFWNRTRTLPLRDDELRSYLQRDSIRLVADSLKSIDSLKNRTFAKWASRLMLGDRIVIGKKSYVKTPGLLFVCTDYNFVDGFRIGQRIEAGINLNRQRSSSASPDIVIATGNTEPSGINTIVSSPRLLSIAPTVYYTTARREVDFIIDGMFKYAPLKRGILTVSTGNTIADFAGQNGSGRFANTLGSMLVAANTAKFYQKQFVTVSNKIDIANGLNVTAGFNYENRKDLENNTSWNIFGKQPASNRPHGQPDRMSSHKAYTANIEFDYTPRHYYRIRNGTKQYLNSSFPTFRLRYSKGFSGSSRINSSFDNIETTVIQNIRVSLFSTFFYGVNAGAFLSAKNTHFPDYRHFQANEMYLTGKSFNTSFTMDNYRYATNEKWLQAHVAYSSQYLFLKRLPILQPVPLEETVHLKTLWTPDVNHNEAGYSIGLGDQLRIGVFVCFRGQSYESVGLILGIPLLNAATK